VKTSSIVTTAWIHCYLLNTHVMCVYSTAVVHIVVKQGHVSLVVYVHHNLKCILNLVVKIIVTLLMEIVMGIPQKLNLNVLAMNTTRATTARC